MSFALLDEIIARAMRAWRPPAKLSLAAWAERHFVLSAETAAEPGRWHTLPYQREILESISDARIREISVMKSARVGYTLCVSTAIGYFMEHAPSSIMVVQPTVDDAKGFSKETVTPMLRDVPILSRLVFPDDDRRGRGPKDPSSTLTLRKFPGGVLSLAGANSGAGLRRISRKVVILDEVDAYPASAGNEGDPVLLAKKRAAGFHDRKIIAGSTPLIAGSSRIEEMFLEGDQRRYHVPCPHCGHRDILAFREGTRGHFMRWDPSDPGAAFFVCRGNGCVIEHVHKRWMVERGEWIPDNPGAPNRSYHLWAAMSYAPTATWGQIAIEFVASNAAGPQKLQTFINTVLGETWRDHGDAPDWERLYDRREHYPIGTVPSREILMLTCGVDVQQDRLVYEVVGWSALKESWSIEAGILWGGPQDAVTWAQVDALLARTFPDADGGEHPITMLAIDSSYSTQAVYGWARRHPMTRVIACKGSTSARALVGAPSTVDVNFNGRRMQRGYKVWSTGVDIAKAELYGWLRLRLDAEGSAPPGYCHFPEHGEAYFQELTAEHLVTTTNARTKRTEMRWHQIPNRENHYLDARILARVAAAVLGIDRRAPTLAVTTGAPPAATTAPAPAPPAPARAAPARTGSFWGGGRGTPARGSAGSWWGRRR